MEESIRAQKRCISEHNVNIVTIVNYVAYICYIFLLCFGYDQIPSIAIVFNDNLHGSTETTQN